MGIFGDYAVKYFEQGINVMPVIGKGQPTENRYAERWSKNKMTDEEFEFLVNKNPNANIGLLTGEASGQIGFDFDYTGPKAKELESIILNLLPPTDQVKIGRKGFTRMYKYGGHASIKRGWKIGDDLVNVFEIISNGRYTIVPPSIHPDTGTPYTWANGEYDPSKLVELPGYVIGAIIDACDIFFGVKKDTGRNNAIFAYALKCIHEHESYESWKSAIVEYDLKKFGENSWFNDNKENNNQDVEKFIEKMCRSWLKSITKIKKQYENIDFKFGEKFDDVELFFPKDIEKISKKYKSISDGFCYFDKEDKLKPLYIEFARYMYEVEGLRFYNKNYSFIHNGKYFENVNDLVLKKIISKRIFDGASVNYIGQYFKRCEVDCQEKGPVPNPPEGFINLLNGVFDIKSKKLLPHSKQYFFTNNIDAEYDENAKCENWIKFLNFIFENDQGRIDLVRKIFGYCLIGGYPFLHKSFVLVGDGRNGKSTLLNVLKQLIGIGVSHVPMSELDKPFSAIQMVGKLANIVEETPDGEINSEIFKNIVSGGAIQVSHKNKDQYSAVINARLVFACNEMPVFRDKKESMLDRLVMIPFNVYIPENERDTLIGDRLKLELSGIFNWAVSGAEEVLRDRRIDAPNASLELKNKYREETDNVFGWVSQNLSFEKANKITSKKLYALYCYDTEDAGQYPLSREKFFRRMKKICLEKLRGKVNISELNEPKFYDSTNKRFRGYSWFSYIGTADQNTDFKMSK